MFKVLGITDEVTTCDCCGKKNLKCTVALEDEAGEVVYYGRDCAGAAVYGRKTTKNTAAISKYAQMVQLCRDVLPVVLSAISKGENPSEAARKVNRNFEVDFGRYADTGRVKPLRIYFGNWNVPGVEIPAEQLPAQAP